MKCCEHVQVLEKSADFVPEGGAVFSAQPSMPPARAGPFHLFVEQVSRAVARPQGAFM